jgi:replicative DNA helicase
MILLKMIGGKQMNTDNLTKAKREITLIDYIPGKKIKAGTNIYRVNPCPMCGGKDHFTIYLDKNTYSSFSGCCKGGTIIDYLIEIEKLEKNQSIQKVLEMAGYDYNFKNKNERKVIKMYSKTMEKHDFKGKEAKATENESTKTYKSVDLTSLFNNYYTSDKNDLTYFIERHINDLDDKYLFIGGINPKDLFKDHSALLPNLNNISDYETVIPVWENGKIVNCILRRNDKKSNDNCKTLNLKGCEVKLFNADYLKQVNEVIFVTEGIFDCLSIECLGYKSIALNSANMANKFIDLVKSSNCKSKFILCGDNDKAGETLNKKLSEVFSKLNIESEVFSFNCDYKDINEYYIANKIALKAEIANIFKPSTASYLDTFLKNIEINKTTKVISTGFQYTDKKLNGGLYPGLYTIGAISSLGKTALTLQIADNIAESGQSVLFFSLEMPKDELISRSISKIMFNNNSKLCENIGTNQVLYGKTDYCNDEFIKAFNYYRDNISNNLEIIECKFNITHQDITTRVKNYIKKTGIKPVVFIDYLQIINISKDDVTEKRGIDNIVKALKQLSRDLKLAVVVVSSFNRDSYKTPVSFTCFKESGGIEYTSDFVLGLHLTVLDDLKNATEKNDIKLQSMLHLAKDEFPRRVSLVILKNRNGKSHTIQQFKFYSKNNLFEEIEPFPDIDEL